MPNFVDRVPDTSDDVVIDGVIEEQGATLLRRQRKYIKGRLQGLTKSKSALLAGYEVSNSTVETKKVKETMSLILDRMGLSMTDLAMDLKAGLKKPMKYYRGKASPDYAVRHKYLETAFKVRGELDKNEKSTEQNIQILIVDYEPSKRKTEDEIIDV